VCLCVCVCVCVCERERERERERKGLIILYKLCILTDWIVLSRHQTYWLILYRFNAFKGIIFFIVIVVIIIIIDHECDQFIANCFFEYHLQLTITVSSFCCWGNLVGGSEEFFWESLIFIVKGVGCSSCLCLIK